VEGVSKKLNRFQVHHVLLEKVERYKAWVDSSQCSNHFPIMLELDQGTSNLEAPFKYNPSWFGDQKFQDLVKASWNHYDKNLDDSTCSQFTSTVKVLKEKVSFGTGERYGTRDS